VVGEKIDLSSYVPSEDEEFMNVKQRAYFRAKLVAWRNDILREARETLDNLAEENANHADIADRASSETDRAIELRARDRQRKLISKIDAALQRIDEGTYGYCEETGEPISLKRLDARPIATLSPARPIDLKRSISRFSAPATAEPDRSSVHSSPEQRRRLCR
jgi:DnaK suppressor protein